MVAEATVLDITNEPDPVRLAEEVRATGTPRLLRHNGEDLAMLVPVKQKRARTRPRREPSQTDIAAFRAAAGGWKGNVDGEAFKRDNRASRYISFKPPVRL